MQSFTNKDKKKNNNNKKYKIILFLKSINCCKYIYIYIYIFSQTKTCFCYFNKSFEMSCIVVFLIFDFLNTKYLPFRIPNVSTLILS